MKAYTSTLPRSAARRTGPAARQAERLPDHRWRELAARMTAFAAQAERLLMAGSSRPLRSPVRPLSNALQAFNTQWPRTPYGSGMNRHQGWPMPTPVGTPAKGGARAN